MRKCFFHFSLPYLSPLALLDFGVASLLLLMEVTNFKPANQHFRKQLCILSLVALVVSTRQDDLTQVGSSTHLASVNTGTMLRGPKRDRWVFQLPGTSLRCKGIAESLGTIRELRK